MSLKYYTFLVCLLMITIFFAGCVDESSVDTPVSSTPYPGVKTTAKVTTVKTTVTPQEEFTLVESHVETGQYGNRYVVGIIKSNVNKQFSYAQVTINEYDSSGIQVGSTLANVNNLEPYGTWKFKAPILEESAEDFKVMKFTAF